MTGGPQHAPETRTILLLTRERHPCSRPDIQDLWGAHLPTCGIRSVLVAERASHAGPGHDWGGGPAVLCGPFEGRYLSSIRRAPAVIRALWRHAAEADALMVRDEWLSGLAMLVVGRIRRKPCFFWMSFPYPEDDLTRVGQRGLSLGAVRAAATLIRGLLGRWLQYGVLLPACDHIFVQSTAMRDMLLDRGMAGAAMTVAPMCVDTVRLDAAATTAPALPFPEEARIVVHLGAMDGVRNPAFLVEALSLVRRRIPDAVLVFVGDAPEALDRVALDTRVAALGLKKAVHVTGWLPREMAWALCKRASVGVNALPGGLITRTMSPTKVVELMALGLPMVVTEHPDMGPVVRDGKAGLVVPMELAPFADAVADLLEAPESERRAMGQRGHAHVETHRSYAALAQRLANVFFRLTAIRRPGP